MYFYLSDIMEIRGCNPKTSSTCCILKARLVLAKSLFLIPLNLPFPRGPISATVTFSGSPELVSKGMSLLSQGLAAAGQHHMHPLEVRGSWNMEGPG